jgi:hypothetical protein
VWERDGGRCTYVDDPGRRGREPADGIGYVTGDLLTGEGIEPAVDGAEIIVHLAGGPKGQPFARCPFRKSVRSFGQAAGAT